MSIRDKEIDRLEKYAKGLGISKISYRTHKVNDPGACWILYQDSIITELMIYIWPKQSKRTTILNLVHELGHHLAWIYRNRKETKKSFEAFYKEDLRLKKTDPLLPKEQRKMIYEGEKFDAGYRDIIWHEVGIKIDPIYLKADKQLDIWGYKMYYLRGNHPTQKECRDKSVKIKQKLGIQTKF